MAKRTLLARLEAKERELDRLIIAGADLDEIVKAHGEECEAHDRYERAETGRQRALAVKIANRVTPFMARMTEKAIAEMQESLRHPAPCMEAHRGRNSGLTHCKRGHEFTVENTAWRSTGKGKPKQRLCRQCMRDKQAIRPIRPEVLALIRGEK